MNAMIHAIWIAFPNLCRTLVQIGLSALLQTTLLLVLALYAGSKLRRRNPAMECLTYRAALAGVIACLLLSVVLVGRANPLFHLSLPSIRAVSGAEPLDAAIAPRKSAAPDPFTLSSGGAARPSLSSLPAAKVEVTPAPTLSTMASGASQPMAPFKAFLRPESPYDMGVMGWVYMTVVMVWLAVVVGQISWLLMCSLGIYGVRRRSVLEVDGETATLLRKICEAQGRCAPELRVSTEVRSVYLTGLLRPAILLPVGYEKTFDREALRAILSHEVAHLVWWDGLWSLLFRLTCAVFWLQPLLRTLRARWEQTSEEVCDLAAVQTGSSRAYAACLLRLAERLSPLRAERVAGLGVVGVRSSLGRRIERLLTLPTNQALLPAPPGKRFRAIIRLSMICVTGLSATLVSSALPDDSFGAGDPRLDQRVKISAEGVALSELLPLISQKTGITLTASRYVADDKVVLFGPPRPLKEILGDIAALFHDNWAPEKEADGQIRYQLTRDLKSRRYEETLAQAGDVRLLAHLEALIKALGESPEQLAKRDAKDPVRVSLGNPSGRLATSIFALLTPAQRGQLIENWQVKLPVTALNSMQKDGIEYMFHGDQFKPDANGLAPTEIPRSEMEKHFLSFGMMGGWGEGRRTGFSEVFLQAPTGFTMPVTEFHASAKFLLPPHGDPYTGAAVAVTGLPQPKDVQGIAEPNWVDRLKRLSEKTGQPIVADYYRSKSIHVAGEGEDASDPNGAIAALDGVCRPEGYLWWTHGKTLLMRKRDWYTQRQYEVPDRWVLALAASLRAHKNSPTYGDIFSLLDLSTSQLVGLAESAGGIADRRLFTGLRELLAASSSGKVDRSSTLPEGVLGRDLTFAQAAISINLSDPRQRAAVSAFLAAFNRKLIEQNNLPGFFGFLFHSNVVEDEGKTPRTMQLDAHIVTDETMHAGYLLKLPLILPDDRRDRTKIE